MPRKKAVVLRGIHVSVHCPTEERLMVQLEGLSPDKFRKLAVALEDYFLVVDDAFKETWVKGRGWKGRGRRVTAKSRVRVLRFSPFPSRFSNILRTVRRNIYCELHKQCVVLEGTQYGGYKQNIYLLPYRNAPAFMAFIETQNKIIDDLNSKIKEFQATSYWVDLKEIFKQHKVDASLLNRNWVIRHIQVDAMMLMLEPSTVEQLIEQEYKKMFEKLREEEKRGLELLNRELERQRQELVIKAVENLRQNIQSIVKRIISQKKLDSKKAKKELARLRNIAVDVGLESLAISVIDPLTQVVENPERATELLGKDIPAEIDGRIKGLLESL